MANLIPEGFYRAVAVKPIQFGESGTGTKQVLVQFEILDGEHAGRVLPWFGFFSEKAHERTLEALRLCGFKGDDLMSVLEQPMNQEVSVTVGHNTYEGKTHARVDWVNAPGGGGVTLAKPMGSDQFRQFAAQMKARLAKVPAVDGKKAERGTPAPANGASREPGADDGDRAPWEA